MTSMLAELGGRFAGRWAALLVVPGMIYTLGATAAWRLGHADWADIGRLSDLPTLTGSGSPWVVLVVALPVLSAAAALTARGIAALLAALWFEQWPQLLGPLAQRLIRARRSRWERFEERYSETRESCGSPPQAEERERLDAAAGLRNRIALVPPARPTWTGDRLRAIDQRVWNWYRLDIVFTWPRVWLVLNESEQQTLREARQRIDAAVGLAGWGVMCLVPAIWWWPALLPAVILFALGHRQTRSAVDAFAHFVEAVYDLRGAELARALGFPTSEGSLPPQIGEQVTAHLRKHV